MVSAVSESSFENETGEKDENDKTKVIVFAISAVWFEDSRFACLHMCCQVSSQINEKATHVSRPPSSEVPPKTSLSKSSRSLPVEAFHSHNHIDKSTSRKLLQSFCDANARWFD